MEGTADTLDRGREAFRRNAWLDAHAHLSAADRDDMLEPDDLERLATAAYLVGTILSAMRWPEDAHLFVLGILSFAAATVARAARRRRWRGWLRLHITGMGLSYIVLLTAFYVDNGPHLPLWRDLTVAYSV